MDDKLKALSRKVHAGDEEPPQGSPVRRLKGWMGSLVPWILGVGALLLGFILFGEQLMPAAEVEIEPVVTLPGEERGPQAGGSVLTTGVNDPFEGSVLFQASGWFEADPFPFRATALASGVVETVHVLEGQPVMAGEPIATLIREDAELRLRLAEAKREAASASLQAAASELELAHARVESMRQEIKVAKARRQELADLAVRAKELGPEVLAEQDIIQSALRLETQDQTIAALQAQLREREIEAERLAGQLRVRQGMLSEAEVRLREAGLEFERTVIRAPVDGIIQRLTVAPGQKKVLMADNPDSATVALLFQPGFIQARIDVPIAEASRLWPGQAVLLESEFLPGKELRGHVQRILGEADLQRNTLQVKVRIENPPRGLRPEILCRARFLDTSVGGTGEGGTAGTDIPAPSGPGARLRVMVPQSALIEAGNNTSAVWAVDESGRRIERRTVSLSGEERDGYVAVRGGLRPGDRVVVRPSGNLRDGDRIKF